MAQGAGDATIFALSTAPGRAGIAVVRVSGARASEAIVALTGRPAPEPRKASLRGIFGLSYPPFEGGSASLPGDGAFSQCEPGRGNGDTRTGGDTTPPRKILGGAARRLNFSTLPQGEGRIDEALVLFFPAPDSATGEDVAEFHVHGGRAVLEAVLQALGAVTGLRPAERGEFTRRAVEHGKLDLTRAEGLADLIDAETEAQRVQALGQYGGALAVLYDDWRQRLIRLCAWVEAEIDFSEEEIEADLVDRARAGAAKILEEIRQHLADSRRGEITRDGLHLTVIGKPNAGKSSLVNALARREVAIVSAIPGTTRDIVETRLDLGGYAVLLADTAGLREAKGEIEAEGVRRALARADAADLVLLVLDGTDKDPFDGFPAEFFEAVSSPPLAGEVSRAARRRGDVRVLAVWNKSDLPWPAAREGLKISARSGEGLDALIAVLVEHVRQRLDRPGEAPIISRARHRHALQTAADALARALGAGPLELLAEDLRLALRSIGRITGRVDIEQLLDVVFRDFCIGK